MIGLFGSEAIFGAVAKYLFAWGNFTPARRVAYRNIRTAP